MDDPPLPRQSQRLQETHERIHEELDQLGLLPPFDQNLPLHCSRRDSPLPFTHIDLMHPFIHRQMNLEASQIICSCYF